MVEDDEVLRQITMIAAAVLVAMPASAQRQPPYWASINTDQARMRTGPGKQYPAIWLYQRRGLPLKVIETFPNWRKVEDPDGTRGWIQANLLSGERTGMITRNVRPLRALPDVTAQIAWRAEPGVIGKLSDCDRRWCKFDAAGRAGYVEISHMFGADGG